MPKNQIINKKDSIKSPKFLDDTFTLSDISPDVVEEIYKKIKLIRETEIKIALERKEGNIGGPVHLSIGQEAIPTGISINLKNSDFIFGNHRSHSHVIALGSSISKLFAELLGKQTGLSKGRGGSMHLIDKTVGFMGSAPIVGGTISLAVGAGFAIKQKSTNDVALVFLGDGAAEEGCFHESLNLAKINNLPVIFVVENNLFSSHMDISLRQPSPHISRFAEANCIPYKLTDGNNVVDVLKSSAELIKNSREQKGPGLIEAITYRWLGHVDWRDDIDVGINRCEKTLQDWKEKCPLKRLRNSILKENIMSEEDLNTIDKNIEIEIKNKWQEAIEAPFPNKESLLRNIFT